MFTDLPTLTGLEDSALLGDLTLLAGDRSGAAQLYLKAWRRGDPLGLSGFLAMEAERAPVEVLRRCGRELIAVARQGQMDDDDVESLVRTLMMALALLRGAPDEASALAIRALCAAPSLSIPLLFRGAAAPPRQWLEACAAVWRTLKDTEDVEARGNLVFKLHHLSLSMPVDELARDEALMDVATQGATGALLYLVLRHLDRLAARPLAHEEHPPRAAIGGADTSTSALSKRQRKRARSFLKFLANHLKDRRERAVFQLRYADWLWGEGDHDEAAELYKDNQGAAPVPVADVARERLQRLHVAQQNWLEAATIALERAERCDDVTLRMALLLLSLTYLFQGGATPERYAQVAERVVALEGHGRQMPSPPFRYAFEVIEGALLEMGQWEALAELWARSSATAQHRHTRAPRTPQRVLEGLMVDWHKAAAGGAEPLNEIRPSWLALPSTRRLLVLRAMRDRQPERALLVLQQAQSLDEHEQLLKAALALQVSADFDQGVGGRSLSDSTLAELLRRLEAASTPPTPQDFVTLYLIRAELKRRDQHTILRQLTERLSDLCPAPLKTALEIQMGHDLLDAGLTQEALKLSREAFARTPAAPGIRKLMASAARQVGDETTLAQLAETVDNDALTERLSHDAELLERFQSAELRARNAQSPPFERLAAVQVMVDMTTQVQDLATQAALLRRASELSADVPKQAEQAMALAVRAVELRPNDTLALTHALDLLLSMGRFEPLAALITASEGFNVSLGAMTTRRLLQGGLEALAQGQHDNARTILKATLTPLIVQKSDDLHRALEALGELYARSDDPSLWRSHLEELLGDAHGQEETSAELNAALGVLYETALPDREMAIEHYRAALHGERVRADSLAALERLFSQSGRYEELAHILRQQAEAARGIQGASGLQQRAGVLESLAKLLAGPLDQPAQARATLNEVLDLTPQHLDALLLAAELDRRMERWESRVATLERAARLVEDQRQRSVLYHDIAQIYEQRDQINLAVENYMVSFMCDNRHVATFRRLETLYERYGRWGELVGVYELAIKTLEQDPDHGYDAEQLWARKSQVEFHHLEREGDAARSLLEALRLNPHDERYVRLLETIAGQERDSSLLIAAYQTRIAALNEHSEARRDLMLTLAERWEALDRLQPEALDTYRAVLTQWPHNQRAAERVESLCKQLALWPELVAFYQERLDAASSAEAVIPLCWAIAQVAERKLRDLDLAIRTYTALLDIVPGNLDVLRALGRLFEATKQWDRLIEISQREVKLTAQPDKKAHVYFKMGSIHETFHQDLTQAIACYEAAIELDPRCVPALHGLREIHRRQSDWPRVIQTLEREATLWDKPREQASIHAMIADVYRDNLGDLLNAEHHVRLALTLAENFQGARRRLLELHMVRERWAEALELALDLSQRSEDAPRRARAALFYKRAVIAQHMGMPGDAVTALRIALDIDPENRDAFELYLKIWEEYGQTLASEHDQGSFLTDLEQDFESRQAHQGLARLAVHRGRLREQAEDIMGALALYDEALSIDSMSLPAQFAKTDLQIRMRCFDDAIGAWRALLEEHDNPGTPTSWRVAAWTALGALHTDWLRQPGEGLVCYERALALSPQAPEVLYQAAQCATMMGRWHEALNWMDTLLTVEGEPQAEQGSPSHRRHVAEHCFYRGRVLELGFGDEERALRAYSRARTLHLADTRSTIAASTILHRQNNHLRLDNLLRGTIDALEQDHPAQADALRVLHSDTQPATAEDPASTQTPSGAAPAAQSRQATPTQEGGPQPPSLDDDYVTALRDIALNADIDPRRRWMVGRALFGMGIDERNLQSALKQLEGSLTHAGAGLLPPPEGEESWLKDMTWSPDAEALAALRPALARAFPGVAFMGSDDEEPPSLKQLGDSTAQWLAAHEARLALRILPGSADTPHLSWINNLPTQGTTLAAISAPSAPSALNTSVIQFWTGYALALLHLGLAPLAAMAPEDVARCLLIATHVQQHDEVTSLEARPSLTSTLAALTRAGLNDHRPALQQCARLKPIEDLPDALKRATLLLESAQHVADRVGLIACGDPVAAALAFDEPLSQSARLRRILLSSSLHPRAVML